MAVDELFLEVIRENSSDPVPRLIYADWLEENGNSDKAAFLRMTEEIRERVEKRELVEKDSLQKWKYCCERVFGSSKVRELVGWLSETEARLFACEIVEPVLPLYQFFHIDGEDFRKTLETSRQFARGGISEYQLDQAYDAALDRINELDEDIDNDNAYDHPTEYFEDAFENDYKLGATYWTIRATAECASPGGWDSADQASVAAVNAVKCMQLDYKREVCEAAWNKAINSAQIIWGELSEIGCREVLASIHEGWSHPLRVNWIIDRFTDSLHRFLNQYLHERKQGVLIVEDSIPEIFRPFRAIAVFKAWDDAASLCIKFLDDAMKQVREVFFQQDICTETLQTYSESILQALEESENTLLSGDWDLRGWSWCATEDDLDAFISDFEETELLWQTFRVCEYLLHFR